MSNSVELLTALRVSVLTDSSPSLLPTNHRLAEVSWRYTDEQRRAGKVKRSAVCVAVPLIPITVVPQILNNALVERFEAMQDKIIANHLNALIAENEKVNLVNRFIPLELTTAEGIAAIADEETAKGRLSKEAVALWFSQSIESTLTLRLLEKNPDLTETETNAKLEAYKIALVSLTANKVSMPVKQANIVQDVINLAEDGKIKRSLLTVVGKLITPVTTVDLESI